MNRRNFIVLSGIGAVALGTSYWFLNHHIGPYDPMIAEPLSLSGIWERGTIIDAGEAYRKKFPKERSERFLVTALTDQPTDAENALAARGEQVSRDFEDGKTVMVDGWVLSVTEARQCALFSILQPK